MAGQLLVIVMGPRFTLADVDRAHDEWGANCGPTSLAAIVGLTLDEVRPHMGATWPGYTNPTCMFTALRSIRLPFRRGGIHLIPTLGLASAWPRWGLCRIQWLGPWTEPGVPMKARYRQTHWVGAAYDARTGIGVWDVNALGNGTGWVSIQDWQSLIVPSLLEAYPRASGGWALTHAIEVDKNAIEVAGR